MPFLRAFGGWAPDRVVTNAEIAPRIGREPEWIFEVSGIEERRWAGPDVTVADMGAAAAEQCLANARAASGAPVEPGLVLMASGTAERRFPGPAAVVAHRLGLCGKPAIDVPVASAGSLFGLALASQLCAVYGDVLVVAAEKMSAAVDSDPMDPNSGMLFGDGAGACLVSKSDGPWLVVDWVLHSDGSASDLIQLPLAGVFAMDGMGVIMHASRKIPNAILEVLRRHGMEPGDIDQYLLHQANQNLLGRVAKSLGVPASRVFSNIRRYGNTSSASMLLAAAEAGPSGANLCFAAFGAGLHWGALIAKRVA